ncbi:thiosulfate oxidation carrier protein SoxY [uncultured Thiothrix sp.]|uniref:thiosulfate oxidation carrier protein SoxY n=1 Tax=uncultured Thiothrix sp. TaxID=223185 RepID=UPI00260D3001|nr:thiosulfate oxidation carrier protein SoxY [uncultured Thiothrix sp.]
MKRRRFLSNTLAVGATGIAISSGFVSPSLVFAAEESNTNPFAAKTLDDVLKMLNAVEAKPSTDVQIKAPEIAENGAVVPLTVSSSMAGVTGISIVVANNPTPLAATFTLPEGTKAEVSTRIKMAKTSEVLALVQTKEGLFSAKQEIKVTIGGCGG